MCPWCLYFTAQLVQLRQHKSCVVTLLYINLSRLQIWTATVSLSLIPWNIWNQIKSKCSEKVLIFKRRPCYIEWIKSCWNMKVSQMYQSQKAARASLRDVGWMLMSSTGTVFHPPVTVCVLCQAGKQWADFVLCICLSAVVSSWKQPHTSFL